MQLWESHGWASTTRRAHSVMLTKHSRTVALQQPIGNRHEQPFKVRTVAAGALSSGLISAKQMKWLMLQKKKALQVLQICCGAGAQASPAEGPNLSKLQGTLQNLSAPASPLGCVHVVHFPAQQLLMQLTQQAGLLPTQSKQSLRWLHRHLCMIQSRTNMYCYTSRVCAFSES